jgi:hypothetical protein
MLVPVARRMRPAPASLSALSPDAREAGLHPPEYPLRSCRGASAYEVTKFQRLARCPVR